MLVQLFLEHGAGVNIQDELTFFFSSEVFTSLRRGYLPVHTAILKKKYKVVEMLHLAHSDHSLRTVDGETSVGLAHGDASMLSILQSTVTASTSCSLKLLVQRPTEAVHRKVEVQTLDGGTYFFDENQTIFHVRKFFRLPPYAGRLLSQDQGTKYGEDHKLEYGKGYTLEVTEDLLPAQRKALWEDSNAHH